MATKKMGDDWAEAFKLALRRWVDDKHKGVAKDAATKLGISPPHMSDLLGGKKRPGVPLLVLFRKQVQLPIDEIMGLPQLDGRTEKMEAQLARIEGKLAALPVPAATDEPEASSEKSGSLDA